MNALQIISFDSSHRDGPRATNPFAQYQEPRRTSSQGKPFPEAYDAILLQHLTCTADTLSRAPIVKTSGPAGREAEK